MKKIFQLNFVAIMLLCSISFFAQSNDNETRKVRERVGTFLKTVSEKNWEETYKYVAVVVRGKDKTHIKKLPSLKNRMRK